ncbi:hypothetical protein U27_02624 [Candidatus Vecturithrix granuli]|uniref:Uncharacterized protein n=1 Tax=Vecturithrix granuli TaxID=1499967 RepID=A0A081CB36_VECG1|nr:hypothetical protein U27_02624 [Candidatus Vecturithrix granuli]
MSFTVVYKGHKQVDGKLIPGSYVRTNIERVEFDKSRGEKIVMIWRDASKQYAPASFIFMKKNLLRVVVTETNGGLTEGFIPDDIHLEFIPLKRSR